MTSSGLISVWASTCLSAPLALPRGCEEGEGEWGSQRKRIQRGMVRVGYAPAGRARSALHQLAAHRSSKPGPQRQPQPPKLPVSCKILAIADMHLTKRVGMRKFRSSSPAVMSVSPTAGESPGTRSPTSNDWCAFHALVTAGRGGARAARAAACRVFVFVFLPVLQGVNGVFSRGVPYP